MSQHCPVCKTQIWTGPLLTPGRIRCPRCDIVFQPTIPWVYFRGLFLVVVALVLVLVVSLPQTNFWLLLFLVGLIISFLFLPRFVGLEQISRELTTPEGSIEAKHLELQSREDRWQQKKKKSAQKVNSSRLIYILAAIFLLLLVIVGVLQKFTSFTLIGGP